MVSQQTLFERRSIDVPVIDAAMSDRCWSMLDPSIPAALAAEHHSFLNAVLGAAPYLARGAAHSSDAMLAMISLAPEACMDKWIEDASVWGRDAASAEELAQGLRQLKSSVHLLCAFAEISGAWTTLEMTRALSRFADACVAAALLGSVRFMAEKGRIAMPADPDNPLPGLFVLALGKLGAEELNYSSDIDLVVMFDPSLINADSITDIGRTLPRLIQAVCKCLQEQTPDGYVFRVDLRLRPDPLSTPIVVSTNAAMRYYEALGQNWERAAYIKARTCAGDQSAAQAFLEDIDPFIWRRAIDFAAVDDIRSLARQIQRIGNRAQIQVAGHDLKLGLGGIREIEFMAQIPQLVFGGRDKSLRIASPVRALKRLVTAKKLVGLDVSKLEADYYYLRAVEHRLQMLEDEPTQTLPEDQNTRRRVAALCGESSIEVFDQRIREILERVHNIFTDQFDEDDSLSSVHGSLVFTGVEPTPDTLKTLEKLGFSDPKNVWAKFNAWAAGRARAVRTARARQLLTLLAPRLVSALAETGEPDGALVRFATFFENLPMGVQPLSMLKNEPQLADDLVKIVGLAPQLAKILAQRPATLDVMFDPRFSTSVADDSDGDERALLDRRLDASAPFEDVMNDVRRLVREERFRIGAQILTRRAGPTPAGRAYADLADQSIRVLTDATIRHVADRFGPPPGEFAILGMGKLGGRELAADSDLDLMLVYDVEKGREGDDPERYFSKLSQRLISALSVPAEEGELYEVDMQLRPSGNSGPVAVRLSRFEDYYNASAWTWEHLALTRARIVYGPPELSTAIYSAIDVALNNPRDADTIRKDAAEMRERMRAARPPKSVWDIKLRAGGLIDIEFIAQTQQLLAIQAGHDARKPSTFDALANLSELRFVDVDDAKRLIETGNLYFALSQLLRTAHGSGFDPKTASRGFATLLAETAGVQSLEKLEGHLDSRADFVSLAFNKYVTQHSR
jgi:[glutamine synthetase] adenylyltransferase / [glutamine synthetase]-adenylyl-L-tyrosine phosphorylase